MHRHSAGRNPAGEARLAVTLRRVAASCCKEAHVRQLVVNTVSGVLITVVVVVAGTSAVATVGAFELPFQHVKPRIVLVRDTAGVVSRESSRSVVASCLRSVTLL
jgi:hypothetical protein